jgi:hypothetical protein
MRSAVRRARLGPAAVALLAALLVTPFSAWHAFEPDICEPVLVLHDAAAHRYQGPETDPREPPGEHCAICHWVRSLNPLVTLPARLDTGNQDFHLFSVVSSDLPRTIVSARIPARAPPPSAL